PDSGAEVGRNVRGNVPFLPGGEAASNRDLDRASLAGHAQKLYGTLKAGFRRSAIIVQRSGRSGDELGHVFPAEAVRSWVRYRDEGRLTVRYAFHWSRPGLPVHSNAGSSFKVQIASGSISSRSCRIWRPFTSENP